MSSNSSLAWISYPTQVCVWGGREKGRRREKGEGRGKKGEGRRRGKKGRVRGSWCLATSYWGEVRKDGACTLEEVVESSCCGYREIEKSV